MARQSRMQARCIDRMRRAAADRRSQADASVTDRAGAVCVVMIADCLPVLFCDAAGRAVGAAHAGWRGLAAGIVEKTAERVAALAGVDTSALHAYLGPCIGPSAFEVGADVRDAFMTGADAAQRDTVAGAFVCSPAGARQVPCGSARRSRACGLRRSGVTQRGRRRPLHGHRARALLFLSPRPRDGTHGRADLARRSNDRHILTAATKGRLLRGTRPSSGVLYSSYDALPKTYGQTYRKFDASA